MAFADVLVNLLALDPPHPARASLFVSDLRWGFTINRPATASFRISRADPNVPELLAKGAMVSIERTDGLFPLVGFVTRRIFPHGDPEAQLSVEDHAGALLTKAITPRHWPKVEIASGQLIALLFAHADRRGDPPLRLDLSGVQTGPVVPFTPKAETLASLLDTMVKGADWEWALVHHVGGVGAQTVLYWQHRIGRDLRHITLDQDIFEEATLTEETAGFFSSSLAVAGTGEFSERPGAFVNQTGVGEPATPGFATEDADVRPGIVSPALRGTAVAVLPQLPATSTITATPQPRPVSEAVVNAARRQHHAPELVRERLSLRLAESELDLSIIGLGSLYHVRFKELALGLGVERDIRIIALALGQDGIIEIEADVLPERGNRRN